jgi:hypothetical protein
MQYATVLCRLVGKDPCPKLEYVNSEHAMVAVVAYHTIEFT